MAALVDKTLEEGEEQAEMKLNVELPTPTTSYTSPPNPHSF